MTSIYAKKYLSEILGMVLLSFFVISVEKILQLPWLSVWFLTGIVFSRKRIPASIVLSSVCIDVLLLYPLGVTLSMLVLQASIFRNTRNTWVFLIVSWIFSVGVIELFSFLLTTNSYSPHGSVHVLGFLWMLFVYRTSVVSTSYRQIS